MAKFHPDMLVKGGEHAARRLAEQHADILGANRAALEHALAGKDTEFEQVSREACNASRRYVADDIAAGLISAAEASRLEEAGYREAIDHFAKKSRR